VHLRMAIEPETEVQVFAFLAPRAFDLAQDRERAEAARGFLGSLPALAHRAHVLVGTVTDSALPAASRPDAADVYREAAAARTERDAASVAASIARAGAEAIAGTPDDLPPRIADRYLALKAAGRL